MEKRRCRFYEDRFFELFLYKKVRRQVIGAPKNVTTKEIHLDTLSLELHIRVTGA